MKKAILFSVFLLISVFGFSQMKPAKMLPPDVEDNVKIKAPADVVWEYLLQFDNIKNFGSEIIEKSVTIGQGRDAVRYLTFKNGTKRTEEFAIIAPNVRKLGIKVLDEEITFSRKFYYFEIEKTGASKCVVSMKAYYALHNENQKKKIDRIILAEFRTLLEGLKSNFEN